jgi:thiamine biosynthesis lipoprotein
MGTVWTITVATRKKSREAVSDVVAQAFAEITRVDEALSDWRDGTELNEVNQYAGIRAVSVSRDTYDVVEKACHFSEISDGAFDITFNVMWGVWNFKQRPPALPNHAEIRKRLPLINHRDVVLNPEERTIFLRRKGMKVGLGGIGKGYAVDRVCMLLERHGLKNYIVEGGGDVRLSGSRGREPWRVAVQHPRKKGYLHLLGMTDVAVATSGDYERYFVHDGIRYHHILDPDTGYPARGVCSVTIIASSAVDADALATSVFVLGVREGLQLLKDMPGVEGIIVDESMRSSMSDGLTVLEDEFSGITTVVLAQTRNRAVSG